MTKNTIFFLIAFIISVGINIYFFVHDSDTNDKNAALQKVVKMTLRERDEALSLSFIYKDSIETVRNEMNAVIIPPKPIRHEVHIDSSIPLDSLQGILSGLFNN